METEFNPDLPVEESVQTSGRALVARSTDCLWHPGPPGNAGAAGSASFRRLVWREELLTPKFLLKTSYILSAEYGDFGILALIQFPTISIFPSSQLIFVIKSLFASICGAAKKFFAVQNCAGCPGPGQALAQ
jgi:hypothetical protein